MRVSTFCLCFWSDNRFAGGHSECGRCLTAVTRRMSEFISWHGKDVAMNGSGMNDLTERKRRVESVPMSFPLLRLTAGVRQLFLVEPCNSYSQVLLHDLYNHTQVFTPLN
jgi:hypothetical protein